MNFIKFKLFVWKHVGLLILLFSVTLIIVPLLIIIYFFIALTYFMAIETNIMKSVIKVMVKKKK